MFVDCLLACFLAGVGDSGLAGMQTGRHRVRQADNEKRRQGGRERQGDRETTARAPETTRTKTHVISEGVRNKIMLFLGVRNNIGMGPKNLHEAAQRIHVISEGVRNNIGTGPANQHDCAQ